MFSHVFVGVSDFDRAYAFYAPLMQTLGHAQRFLDTSRPWAGWHGAEGGRPLLVIGRPFDGEPQAAGNGAMVAFQVGARDTVDAAYRVALAAGGTCEGAPGLRAYYHPHYYGAYFRDPDGNKLCVVCHDAPPHASK